MNKALIKQRSGINQTSELAPTHSPAGPHSPKDQDSQDLFLPDESEQGPRAVLLNKQHHGLNTAAHNPVLINIVF